MAASRSRGKKAKTQPARTTRLSTSEARANFKKSLEKAHMQNAFVGFERYGKLVAALVPVDAVRVLAGQESELDASARAQVKRTAAAFLSDTPAAPRGAKKSASKQAKPRGRAKRKALGKSA